MTTSRSKISPDRSPAVPVPGTNPTSPPARLPVETDTLVVGGGVVGASVAYHLARMGCPDVVLLEQNRLAGGTTWHAAGLIGRLRTTNSMTRINKYSAELYASLERETGHPIGWKQVGSLIVARSKERMTQLRRTAAMAEWFGVEVQLLKPQAALERWPLLRIDDVLGAAWLPGDGKLIPQELTTALALGARKAGARVLEGVRVTALDIQDGAVRGVVTPTGRIRARRVVLCGGMWTRQLALPHGVSIPLYPVEHHYAVSHPIPGAHDDLPVGRDPDLCIYFRGEGNAVMLGAFQASSKSWTVPRIPDDFSFKLLEPDWPKFDQPLQAGQWRIPALVQSGFERFVNGPESFTPDNNFLLGETPEVRSLYVAAGFNSVGIASAGGAGKYLAEWILDGRPSIDLGAVDIRRFSPHANNRRFLEERVTEILGLHYQMAWPNREFETGRNLRLSPLHGPLAAAGACFGSKGGWERPNWFSSPGGTPIFDYSFDRQDWFPNHAREHLATRNQAALFDQSSFAKFEVQGPDALSLLQRLCANNVDVPIGRCVYTPLLNETGRYESDLVVVRLASDLFYLVSGSTQSTRDAHWIRTHLRPAERASLHEVTEQWAVLGLMGPHSRTILESLTDTDLSNEAFPFGAAQEIDVGPARTRALRITYVGELGWELHVPTSQALAAFRALQAAGEGHGLQLAGHYAINSLRLEKALRAFGSELSQDETPFEAGLAFTLDWEKDFIGRQALEKIRREPRHRQLVTLTLDDPNPILWGSEPICRDGRPVGYTSSGSYAHTLGRAIALGYVNSSDPITKDWLLAGRFTINVNGVHQPATIHLRPPYDPDRKRVLA